MRRIESIEVFPVLLPVIETFQFASGSAGTAGGEAPHVFVKVTDSEGEVGWGEGRPLPQWSYETLETVETTIGDHLAPALLGLPQNAGYHWPRAEYRAAHRQSRP